MGFWIFMFCCSLLIPVLMIAFGEIMRKHPPKEINDFYGYRTAMSKKNKDTWDFAHAFCGNLWWKIGWIILIPSILIQFPFLYSGEDVIGIVGLILCLAQCAILIGSIFPVEKALKQNFNADGTRK